MTTCSSSTGSPLDERTFLQVSEEVDECKNTIRIDIHIIQCTCTCIYMYKQQKYSGYFAGHLSGPVSIQNFHLSQ